uniref:Uncharacterized protein n=1 Tax=viral metagenome TaxID=1070528 RepID=A0A6H1ZK72_9ZZZZ
MMEENECFERCGKTFVDVRLAEDWQYPARVKRIRLVDVAKYFARESGSISGGRSLVGIFGDWRQIDAIAQDVLEHFKVANVEGMRREARKLGLEPKF